MQVTWLFEEDIFEKETTDEMKMHIKALGASYQSLFLIPGQYDNSPKNGECVVFCQLPYAKATEHTLYIL